MIGRSQGCLLYFPHIYLSIASLVHLSVLLLSIIFLKNESECEHYEN